MAKESDEEKEAQLNEQIAALYEYDRFADAILPAKELCKLAQRMHGSDSVDYAANLNQLARLYYDIGNYEAALPLYREASDINREALGERHPDYAMSLNNLATLYRSTGNYQAAEPLYLEALDIRREALGEHHPKYATSLNHLATLYTSMGNYQAAEPLYLEARHINREALGEHHPDYGRSLNDLATLYHAIGNYEAALPLYREARDISRETLGEHHPKYATSISNLAALYRSTGDYQAAEPLYREALDIRREALGERHPDYAMSLNNLATLYHNVGDYQAAEPLYREASDINREALGERHPDYARSLNNLASLYHAIGNYEAAEPLYREASDINREALGERHPDYAMSIINLGVLYKDMGDYQAAEPLYHEACDILREALGEHHPDYARSLNSLATLYRSTGNYQAAEPLYREASDILREALGEHHPDYARSLNNLAALFASTDRVAESFDLMMRAAAIEDHTIAQVFAIGSESQRMVYLQSIQGSLHAFLTLTSQRCPRSKFTARAAMDLVLRRKALGAEALAAQRDAVLGGKYPALRERLDQLRTLNNKINQKTFARVDADVLGSYREDLKTLNSRKEQLEAELAHQIPEMRLEEQLKTADSQAVAEVIPDDTALVEFARFDEFDFTTAPDHGDSRWTAARYLAFILRTNAPDQLEMIDLGQSDTIDKMVTEFRANIMYSGQARGDYKGKEDDEVVPGAVPEGTDLRKAVFDPLIPHFDNVTRLFIALDGELTRLPFEALPTDDGRRLIDAYHISYLSVGRDILRFTHQIVHELATSLVIADPDFNFGSLSSTSRPAPLISPQSRDLVRAIQEIPPLPGTEEEGRRIADLLHVHPWLQQNALEGPLKAAASPSVFHIATHGFFLENQRGVSPADIEKGGFADLMVSRISSSGVENPLIRSGLILAGASTFLKGGILPLDAEDGMLTALDVSGLDLLATELAVLSACDTGLGDVQTGEGVFGLRRAFMLAGAKTLVMSLWAVDDEVTKELMIDFYTRILAGEGRADALRNAQLAIKAKHPDPYYWGAFICQGDPGPLNKIQ